MNKPQRRRPPHWVTIAIIVVILVGSAVAKRFFRPPADGPLPEPPAIAEEIYEVERAVDGDTIIVRVDGERQRVRLMGIDTPEVFDKSGSGERLENAEPFGPEASAFTKEFVAGGEVHLRFGRRRVDQYNRLLAFVYVDDKMLNEEIVRAGFARAKIYAGDESPLTRQIQKAQDEAQAADRGIWSLD